MDRREEGIGVRPAWRVGERKTYKRGCVNKFVCLPVKESRTQRHGFTHSPRHAVDSDGRLGGAIVGAAQPEEGGKECS